MAALRSDRKPPAILVTSYAGDPGVAEIEQAAADGLRPRKDYVELARRTGGVVIDAEYVTHRAHPVARRVARVAGIAAGQITEAFLRRREFGGILTWADRLGLPLALLEKLTRTRSDIVLVSVALTNREKALPMKRFRLHTQLSALVTKGTAQYELAATNIGVPPEKLHLGVHAVDERFWRQDALPSEPDGPVVAVGWEERDYPTLLRAAAGIGARFELAIGSIAESATEGSTIPELGEVPPNVRVRSSLSPRELRELYARASLVVVPLRDVEFDAGVTTIAEAMAMGKAVVATRTRGQRDLLRDGEHGLYVPPGDVSALREAIEALLRDGAARERMGRAGRAQIEAEHRLDRYVGELADLLEAAAPA